MIPLLSLVYLFALSEVTFGAPTEAAMVAGQSIPLLRRNPSLQDVNEWGALAKIQRDNLIAKYSGRGAQKRSTGYNLYVSMLHVIWKTRLLNNFRIVDQGADSR